MINFVTLRRRSRVVDIDKQLGTLGRMQYQLDKWTYSTWRKETRFYRLDLRQDIFGNWQVLRIWGSNCSRGPGQSIEVACNSYEEAKSLFSRQEKRRRQRGYCCLNN